GAERVQRLGGRDADASPLAGREPPGAVVLAERAAGLVHDRSAPRAHAVALEEGTVVAAAEEARLLALGPGGGGEARRGRLGACLLLRLRAERERDPVEQARVECGEHVRLVLARVDAAGDEAAAVALDDARVVARPEHRRARAGR